MGLDCRAVALALVPLFPAILERKEITDFPPKHSRNGRASASLQSSGGPADRVSVMPANSESISSTSHPRHSLSRHQCHVVLLLHDKGDSVCLARRERGSEGRLSPLPTTTKATTYCNNLGLCHMDAIAAAATVARSATPLFSHSLILPMFLLLFCNFEDYKERRRGARERQSELRSERRGWSHPLRPSFPRSGVCGPLALVLSPSRDFEQ